MDSKDPRQAQAKFGKMNPLTKSKIQLISDYLIRNSITIETLHKTLDINNDGSVDKLEFVDGVSKIITTTSLTRQDLGTIFDAIDLNGDNYLSVNEFGYYLDGAKLQKDQKKA
jgi:Ca2+-binding EF-hand superfamily protein